MNKEISKRLPDPSAFQPPPGKREPLGRACDLEIVIEEKSRDWREQGGKDDDPDKGFDAFRRFMGAGEK